MLDLSNSLEKEVETRDLIMPLTLNEQPCLHQKYSVGYNNLERVVNSEDVRMS